jgi:hypothetical protein
MHQPPPSAPNRRERPPIASVALHPAFLPMLSRATLEGIVDAAIAELDRRDGDPDREPEEDRCAAGDDLVGIPAFSDKRPGDPDDAELDEDREPDFDNENPDDPRMTSCWADERKLGPTNLFRRPVEVRHVA